jgi:hypothetical protein
LRLSCAVSIQLIIGKGAVRVDRVHHPVGQIFQVFRAERLRLLGQQLLPERDVAGVEPSPVHAANPRRMMSTCSGVTSPARCAAANTGRTGS